MKKLVFACVLLGGLVSLGVFGAGCGNKCQALADAMEQRYEDCGVSDPAAGTGKTVNCTEALAKKDECYTPCYKNIDCVLLTAPNSAAAAGPAKTFNDCLAACDSE